VHQTIAHDLGEKKAKQAITAAHRYYARRYSKYKPRMHWESRNRAALTFVATGMTVNATADVKPSSIDVEVEVPLLLRPFRKKALQIIEREIRSWVTKAKSGKLPGA
jgi:hypothetical protein